MAASIRVIRLIRDLFFHLFNYRLRNPGKENPPS